LYCLSISEKAAITVSEREAGSVRLVKTALSRVSSNHFRLLEVSKEEGDEGRISTSEISSE